MTQPDLVQSPQQLAIRRLLEADADAQLCQQQAHIQAGKIIAEGEAVAQQMIREARTAAEAEIVRNQEIAQQQIELAAAKLRAKAQAEVEAMTKTAQTRLAEAVALLVAWVKAEG